MTHDELKKIAQGLGDRARSLAADAPGNRTVYMDRDGLTYPCPELSEPEPGCSLDDLCAWLRQRAHIMREELTVQRLIRPRTPRP